MALTPAEKQERYRERKRKEALALGYEFSAFMKKPFDEWLTDVQWGDVVNDLDYVGVESAIEFPGNGDIDPFWNAEWDEGRPQNALGVAERIVETLLDAAVNMASAINEYKIEEIDARIAEIEAADLSDPAIRKQALADIAKLMRYRDNLSKSVRWTLPQWEFKGE